MVVGIGQWTRTATNRLAKETLQDCETDRKSQFWQSYGYLGWSSLRSNASRVWIVKIHSLCQNSKVAHTTVGMTQSDVVESNGQTVILSPDYIVKSTIFKVWVISATSMHARLLCTLDSRTSETASYRAKNKKKCLVALSLNCYKNHTEPLANRCS